MKRIILPLLTLLVASASGQNSQKGIGEQRVAPTSTPVVLHSQNASGSSSYNLNRGSEFFYEDFSNDLDGSTAFGAWTVSDNADNTIWHMANANSPEGPYIGGTDPLDSETAGNGWVIFDIDAYIGDNPSWGQGDDDYTTGYLTSPELNMTDLSSVLVEFQQYFVYCCFPLSPLTVEVSIDNQESWYVFPGQGEFFDAANVFSANPQVTVVDVSCIAAFQPSVYIRFAYNSAEEAGYNQYIWGIDDVRVYENTKLNDIEITEINTGDIINDYEYQVIPFEQRIMEADGGLVAGATFSNRGVNTQTNVTLLAEILDDADAVIYTFESDPFELTSSITSTDCPSAEYFNLFVSTGFEPTETGVYTLRVTMLGDSIDETPNNNMMMKTIEFSVDEFGHDDIDAIAGYIQTSAVSGTDPVEYNPGGWGSVYKCPNEGSTAYGVAARFGNQSANGVEFKSALIEMDGSVSLTDSPTIAEEYYNMAANWHNGTYKYFPFDNSVELDTTFSYFGCIWRETQSVGRLYVGAQEEEDTDLSSAAWELGGSGEYSWFFFQPYTYSVRLIVSDRVGLDETNNSIGLKSFNLFPNPAVTETRVNFSLEGSRSVAYEIRDLSGKLIQWQNVGDFAPGDNSFTVDVSRVASGNYFLNLVIDGSAMFSQQLNVQK
jgi:Secretion system C-terminal sorting domain